MANVCHELSAVIFVLKVVEIESAVEVVNAYQSVVLVELVSNRNAILLMELDILPTDPSANPNSTRPVVRVADVTLVLNFNNGADVILAIFLPISNCAKLFGEPE